MRSKKTVSAISVFLVALVLGALAGCGRRDEGFLNTSRHLADGSYNVLWRNGEVEYFVFCPSAVLLKIGPRKSLSCQWRGSTPLNDGISLLPEGLFLNGTRLNTEGPNKVFVVQADGSLRPIRIVQKDLENLSQSRIDGLLESDSWPYLSGEFQMR